MTSRRESRHLGSTTSVPRSCGPKAWWLEDRQAPVNGRKDFSEAGAGVGIRTMKPVAGGGPTCPVR